MKSNRSLYNRMYCTIVAMDALENLTWRRTPYTVWYDEKKSYLWWKKRRSSYRIETLTTIITNENDMIEMMKRGILYADFIAVVPAPRQINTLVGRHLSKQPGEIIYIEHNPSLREQFYTSLIEGTKIKGIKEAEVEIKARLEAEYGPFIFISSPKLSPDTQVIVYNAFQDHYERFTLGELYSLSILWELDPSFSFFTWHLLTHPQQFSFSKEDEEDLKKIESLAKVPLNQPMDLSKVPESIFDKEDIERARRGFDDFFKRVLSAYLFRFIKRGVWSSDLIKNRLMQNMANPVVYLDLPFLEGVSLKDLIKMRIREWEPLISFRKSLSEGVQQLKQIYPHENAEKIAKEMQRELQFKATKLDRKFRRMVSIRLLRMISYAPLILASYTPAPNIVGNLAKTGVATLIGQEFIGLWKEMQEMKENEIYFLWKLGHKVERQRKQ